MDNSFTKGIDMYLKMRGIRDQKEQQQWLRQMQQQQFGLQQQGFGLQQKQFGLTEQQTGQTMQLQRMQMQETQRKMQQEQERRQALKNIFPEKKIGEDETAFTERDLPPPGREMEAYSGRLIEEGMRLGDPYFFDLAKGFAPAAEEYTLKPGEQRFRGRERIAGMEPKPETPAAWKPTTREEAEKWEVFKEMAKSKKERVTDFDTKWGYAGKIVEESLRSKGINRAPTMSEIADAYKAKFGTAGLIEMMFGLMSGEGAGPQETPKF